MTDRDRLAADLHDAYCDKIGHPTRGLCHDIADRLIALGWTRNTHAGLPEPPVNPPSNETTAHADIAAAIAKAYREDTDDRP